MCAIIFAPKQLEPGWVQGLDPFGEWNGEHDDLISNSGTGKRYLQGPVCMLNGITMPTMCCCSESGSITAELLVAMLQKWRKCKWECKEKEGNSTSRNWPAQKDECRAAFRCWEYKFGSNFTCTHAGDSSFETANCSEPKGEKSKWKIRCNRSQVSVIERNWKGCCWQLYLCWAEDIGLLVQKWRWCTSSNNKTESINPVPWYISQRRSDAAISKHVDSRGEWCCGMSDAGTLVPDTRQARSVEAIVSTSTCKQAKKGIDMRSATREANNRVHVSP